MAHTKPSKRDLILNAAFELFIEKGYENTKISEIAEEAKIGKSTVYEYFKSKDDLFYEIFNTKVVANYMKLPDLLKDCNSGTESLKLAIRFELENAIAFGNTKNIIPYIFEEDRKKHSKDFFTAMHELMELKFKILFDIINKGIENGEFKKIDPLLATISLVGAINFYMAFSCNVLPSMPGVDNLKLKPWDNEEFFNLIFRGLKK